MDYTNNKTKQKSIVTTMMFLIGVRKDLLDNEENDQTIIAKLEKHKNAVIFRALCNIRSNLMSKYTSTENDIVYYLKNLDRQELYIEDINTLKNNGVNIIKVNHRVNQYIVDMNYLIGSRLEGIKELFPEWVNWEYIKELFIMSKGSIEKNVVEESKKYGNNLMKYPYTRYINWKPVEEGNILIDDKKFLNILYKQHNDVFYDKSKLFDASEDVKTNIYDFIQNSQSVILVVDCENSDAYKLAAVLKQLNSDETSKIEKITLYDDEHTTKAWQFLEKITSIPVEHILVDRIKDNKSLVDMKMGVGVATAFYRDNVDSFILVSSDSDFWGLISSIPEARFLVMVEYSKCGSAIQQTFIDNHIYYCAIDDFCTANIKELKTAVLIDELNKRISDIFVMDTKVLLNEIYEVCRLNATDAEKDNFYNKYIKKLSIQMDNERKFIVKIPV